MERSEPRIKTYEGFFDRFKGEYGFRVGEKPKKEYGKKFLELLEIPVSDIQALLLEITDEIVVNGRSINDFDNVDPEENYKFEYWADIKEGNENIHFAIKGDRFVPIFLMKTRHFKINKGKISLKITDDFSEFSFIISFHTKDIYNEEFNKQTFLQKVKSANFNLSSTNFLSIHLDKDKINIIKECGERICDMINFEKFELDIEKPTNNDGYSLVKLIFKI